MSRHFVGVALLLLGTVHVVSSQTTTVNCKVGGTDICPENTLCILTFSDFCVCANGYVVTTGGLGCVYDCEVLNNIANGQIAYSDGFIENSTATYSCDAGYILTGNTQRTCDGGILGWTGTEPTCGEIDECSSTPCANDGTCADEVNGFVCSCNPGYEGVTCNVNIDECASGPCQNGGICNDAVNEYTCTCVPGYTGTHCEQDIDECASSPCSEGACLNNLNSWSCACNAGYTGINCGTDIQECDSDPCLNGALCREETVGLYQCFCLGGYTSTNCEQEIDECASDACQNGATCNDFINSYTCDCAPGYEGVNCGTETNECLSDPCESGATCNDELNQYSCTCTPGYDGINCENEINECVSNPCQNGATCNDLINQYTCTCVPGYESTNCSIETNECLSNPCENGAVCNDEINQFTCTCADGYDGVLCENDIDECASNPCLFGATCNDHVNSFSCTCVAGYEGTVCAIDTNECASNPCQHGANCTDRVNEYVCTCAPGYESTHCEVDTDECASSPCKNGATCNDEVNGYTCTCAPGYNLTHCNEDIDECASNPCMNGATCNNQVNGYDCTCVAGYESTHCETETNECDSNPCQNEATCNDYVNYYNCTCKAGYADHNCKRDIDECVSLPCQNGGTCTDYVNYFGCACQAGYTDATCRKSVLNDLCHLSNDICDGIPNAACDGTACTCVTGYKDYGNASCYRVDCGPLNTPLNGEVNMDQGTLYEAVATFSCDAGFTRAGSASITCQSTEAWNDAEPVCNIKDCGVLANPTNGQVSTPDGTEFGDTATYTCNVGYILNGVITRTCQADATWTQTAPTCTIVDCLVTAAPIQGTVTFNPNTLYQGYAEFACNTGYTLTGNQRQQCQADGTWSLIITAPTCVINDCGTLTAPTDGTLILTGTAYQSIANFACDNGYDLTGSSSRSCQADTTWDGTPTLCVIKDCGAPAAPANGNVDYSSGTKYLNSASFTCDTGYDLSGVTPRVCQADGNWQSPLPTCVIKNCGSPPATAANTFVTASAGTTYQEDAVYTCAAGYEISSVSDKITCTAAGTWSTDIPVCSRKDCGTLLAPVNGGVDLAAGTLYEASALFSCNVGYTLTGVSSRTCQDDATWSDTNPTCVIKDCGVPPSPTDGSASLATGTTYLDVASFSCDVGYTIQGTATRTCLSTGNWEAPFPTCQINDCGSLTPLANTQVSVPLTTYGSEATYTCDTGYEIATVNDKRTCRSDSSWSTPEPYCTKKDCGTLVDPDSGRVEYSGTLYQNVATYSCDAGYTLTGVTSRTCQDSGIWDGTAPTCNIKDCGSLVAPTKGYVDVSSGTTYLQNAAYSCETGYDLIGSTTRTCDSDGDWTSTAPTCQIKDCGPLTAPSNGAVNSDSGTTYGQTASYQCNEGYNLVGVTTRECLSTGLWSGSISSCVIIDCGTPPSLSNGKSSVFTTAYLSVANYSCENNYGLVGAASVACLSTGNWGTLPSCIPDCNIPTSVADGSVTYAAGTYEGAVATYTCDAGYTMSGGASVTCGADGTWSTAPECIINLEDYNSICFTIQQCKTDRSSCIDDGTGTTRCLCNTNGQFYDSIADSCLTDCGGLSNPTNGVVTLPTQTAEGQIATYSCNLGYALSGESSRTCQASGVWSGLAPTCLTGCTLPDPPLYGNVNASQGLVAGSAITYTCDAGYSLVGQTSRICLTDASFNGEQPECKKECTALTGIKGGTVDLSLGNWDGSLATYICDKNYALMGQSTRLCESTGMWTGSEPTCIFSVFPDIVLVFGALFILLVLVDLIVFGIFIYQKFFKTRYKKKKDGDDDDDKKKPAFLPFMVERPEDGAIPPPSYMQSQNKSTKFSRINPNNDEVPYKRKTKPVHSPLKKPLEPLKVDRADRPSFFNPNGKKNGKPEKAHNLTTVNSYMPPESVQNSTAREDKVVPQVPEMDNKDGYNTGNSDDRAPSMAEEDQMSLNDFDIPRP